MSDGFLREVYGLDSQADTDQYYAKWAATYDDELTENGYRSPGRCALALAQFVPLDQPILDIGCGTGMSGSALSAIGFTVVDGQDPNPAMVEVARERGRYREVRVNDVDDPYPFAPGRYAAMSAIGVIGPGAAPLEVLGQSVDALGSGGHFVFSLNDHALHQPEFVGAVDDLIGSGAVEEVFREHGPHIDSLGSGSNVYVLRRV